MLEVRSVADRLRMEESSPVVTGTLFNEELEWMDLYAGAWNRPSLRSAAHAPIRYTAGLSRLERGR